MDFKDSLLLSKRNFQLNYVLFFLFSFPSEHFRGDGGELERTDAPVGRVGEVDSRRNFGIAALF